MADKEARVGVWSEIGKLRRVLVCPPGLAHERLTPDSADELLYETLSERELAVLQELAQGRSNQEIAATLFLAEGTVKSRCARARTRLAVLLGHLDPDRCAVPVR